MNYQTSECAKLPTAFGLFEVQAFKEGPYEHLLIKTPTLPKVPLVRIHSECLTGDALGSLKCDCGDELSIALERIAKEGGVILYLRQEGRGIGLLNKINAYALQDRGLDTVDANLALGFEEDMRSYDIVPIMLHHYHIKHLRLMTNNPRKLNALKEFHVIREPLHATPHETNRCYLKTKQTRLGHLLDL